MVDVETVRKVVAEIKVLRTKSLSSNSIDFLRLEQCSLIDEKALVGLELLANQVETKSRRLSIEREDIVTHQRQYCSIPGAIYEREVMQRTAAEMEIKLGINKDNLESTFNGLTKQFPIAFNGHATSHDDYKAA